MADNESPGMTFFNPADVLNGQIRFAQLPESEKINTLGNDPVNQEMLLLLNFLKFNGIPLGLGVNSNRDSFFDLYAPYVDILLDEPSAMFGYSLESKVGKMHFFTHDSVHLYSGMPGPRLSDLKNKDEAIDRLARVLMKKEALGSAWTGINHVKWFWSWRKDQNSKENPKKITKQFEDYNDGLNSLYGMPREEYVKLVESYMDGEFVNLVSIYNKYADYDAYRKARDAGVPMLFPDLSKKFGRHFEKLVVKYGFPLLLPLVHMFDPKFGYFTLINFSRSLAAFYYTDWYVEWADRFHVGEPLAEMEENLERKINDFKKDNFMRDVPQAREGIFEVMFIRNALAQYGRKLIELKYFEKDRRLRNRNILTEKDVVNIDQLLKEAELVNNQILKLRDMNKKVSSEQILIFKNKAQELFSRAEAQLPVDRVIPPVDRLDFANYKQFWRDPFAVVNPRPANITKFLSTRGLWKEALRQEREKLRSRELEKILSSEPVIIKDLETKLAVEYLNQKKADLAPVVLTEKTEHLNRIENYRSAFNTQIENVFFPQLNEFSLTQDLKELLYGSTNDFKEQINLLLDAYKTFYTERFVHFSREKGLKEKTIVLEENIKSSVENVFYDLSDILTLLKDASSKNQQDKLRKLALKISDTAEGLRNGEAPSDSIKRTLIKVAPIQKGRFKLICSAIAKLCSNLNVSDLVDTLKTESFARQKQPVKIVFKTSQGEVFSPETLPKNAAFVFAMNHTHGAVDAMALKKVAKMFGIKWNSLLINKSLWPHISFFEKLGFYYKDNRILFHDDEKLKPKVLQALSDHKSSRVAFSLFPEGQLPFWNNQFPLHSEWGAFNYARSASHLLEKDRPVYYVELMSNFMEAMTKEEKVPLEVQVVVIEKVPTGPVGTRDEWVEKRRLEFENRANAVANQRMTDLIENKKIPGTDILKANPVRSYKPVSEFLREKVQSNTSNQPLNRCQSVFLSR